MSLIVLMHINFLQSTSARFCLYTFLLKKIGGLRPIQKLTCTTTPYRATSTKDMNGVELHTTSYLCQPLPDFNSLAGDACEHFSKVLTHVKHISLNKDLLNKLHIHLPLGICDSRNNMSCGPVECKWKPTIRYLHTHRGKIKVIQIAWCTLWWHTMVT